MKTIKQIAEEIGVSKQAVHQKRKKEPLLSALCNFTSVIDGVVYIDYEGEKLIKQAFLRKKLTNIDGNKQNHTDKQFTSMDSTFDVLQTTIDTLSKQLEAKDAQLAQKDKQIADLLDRLSNMTNALLATQKTAQAAQALHAGTIQKQLVHGDTKQSRGLERLFKNKTTR